MHLRNLFAAIIRLSALVMFPTLLTNVFIYGMLIYRGMPEDGSVQPEWSKWYFVATLSLLAVLAFVFVIAPAISAMLTRGFDEPISLGHISLEHIYIIGFVMIGVWCILSRLHIFLAPLSCITVSGGRYNSQYYLSNMMPPLLQIMIGIGLIFGARPFYRFIHKFIEPKTEEPKV